MEKLIVVPTYNERENIQLLLDQLLSLPYGLEVLVVDDNSPDGTGDLVAARDADLVLGSRYLHGVTVVHWPLRRLVLSMGANLYTRVVTGLPVRDATGGFKCFRRRALAALDWDRVNSDGYAFQIEITYKVWRLGLRIKEIPITFVDRRAGVSKMDRRIVWEAAWLVWRLRLMRLLGQLP